MDFEFVAEKILIAFLNAEIRYALMGGFALGIWGVHRATVDMDFLVHRDDLGKVQDIMTGMGYECIYHTDNVSQYVSSLKILGEVDFLHAFRKVSIGIFFYLWLCGGGKRSKDEIQWFSVKKKEKNWSN